MGNKMVKLIECPRDAMQGLHDYIPAKIKAEYIDLLLQVGFDTLDFGSFVSERAIPQMKDTAEVLDLLKASSPTHLLAIVANRRGIDEAVKHERIRYIGFPFSISETFQLRNTNSGIDKSLDTVKYLIEACERSAMEAVIYLSMAFGNPYGDPWGHDIVEQRTAELIQCGARIISLADTTGVSDPEKINYLFPHLRNVFPYIEFGVHLHSTPESAGEKIQAAWNSGCRRFDSALGGYGGCPMAADELTGNIATEKLISFLENEGVETGVDSSMLNKAMEYSGRIFG